jgi:hypothetical protein
MRPPGADDAGREADLSQANAPRLEGRCGRRVSLDDAERLLAEVAVVESRPDTLASVLWSSRGTQDDAF